MLPREEAFSLVQVLANTFGSFQGRSASARAAGRQVTRAHARSLGIGEIQSVNLESTQSRRWTETATAIVIGYFVLVIVGMLVGFFTTVVATRPNHGGNSGWVRAGWLQATPFGNLRADLVVLASWLL